MPVQQGASLTARANHADRDREVGGVSEHFDIGAGLVRRPAGDPRNAMRYH